MAFSKRLVRGGCAVAAAALLSAGGAARAAVVWNITGTFNDGGTLSGQFTISDFGTLVPDFSLTTTAGSSEPGFTYTSLTDPFFVGASPIPQPTSLDFEPSLLSELHIEFAHSLRTSAASDPIVGGLGGASFECVNSFSCPDPGFINFGYAVRYLVDGTATLVPATTPDPAPTPVPEPASWAMMLIGLGGLGAMLRSARRRQALA